MWPRLFRSATFRLTLLAAPLSLMAGWGLLAFVYVNTEAIMERRATTALRAEETRLREDMIKGSIPDTATIGRRIVAERGSARLYLLLGENDPAPLAANIALAGDLIPQPGHFRDAVVTRLPDDRAVPARLTSMALPEGRVLVLGRDLTEEAQFRRVVEETLGIAVGLSVLLALVAGAASSRAVLRRLGGFNATARRLLHGGLDERMPLRGTGDEFDQLAFNLNEALNRIAELMQATRQVSDNIAHDLRGPLSRVRNRLELLALSADGEVADGLAASVEDVDSILDTFEALLTIARLDHGVPPHLEPVALAPLIEDLVDYFLPLAEEKGLSLEARFGHPVTVPADPHLLFQALSNLVDNAIRYTPEGGTLRISVEPEGNGGAVIVVADDGPGIPADKRDDVLGRFVRLDASRHHPGTGLGLSVVDAVVRHHQGRLGLDDNRPGLKVRITLPPPS